MPDPRRPRQLSEYAARTLEALAEEGLGRKLSVGGALGLLHYLDYRSTHDVDAWWSPSATGEERERVLRTIEAALQPFGEIGTRSWGEVVSVELKIAGKKVFSFQLASRSAQLTASETLPWTDVSLDSFTDLIASKMTALVERGAPRDFRDIYTLCDRGMTSARECWTLWAERQLKAGSDADRNRARLAVQTHLTRIAQYRPLDTITDAAQLEEATHVRSWFEKDFLNALVD